MHVNIDFLCDMNNCFKEIEESNSNKELYNIYNHSCSLHIHDDTSERPDCVATVVRI